MSPKMCGGVGAAPLAATPGGKHTVQQALPPDAAPPVTIGATKAHRPLKTRGTQQSKCGLGSIRTHRKDVQVNIAT